MGTARRRTLIVGVALVAAGLLNAVQFLPIERATPAGWRAVQPKPTHDLLDLARRSSDGPLPRQFGVALALEATAPGARLIVDDELDLQGPLQRELLFGIGRVEGISHVALDVDLVADPVEGRVAARGVAGADATPFEVVLGEAAAPTLLVMLERDGDEPVRLRIVDVDLLDADLLDAEVTAADRSDALTLADHAPGWTSR